MWRRLVVAHTGFREIVFKDGGFKLSAIKKEPITLREAALFSDQQYYPKVQAPMKGWEVVQAVRCPLESSALLGQTAQK